MGSEIWGTILAKETGLKGGSADKMPSLTAARVLSRGPTWWKDRTTPPTHCPLTSSSALWQVMNKQLNVIENIFAPSFKYKLISNAKQFMCIVLFSMILQSNLSTKSLFACFYQVGHVNFQLTCAKLISWSWDLRTWENGMELKSLAIDSLISVSVCFYTGMEAELWSKEG